MIDRVRVLVVDDSAYSRRTIIKILETITHIEVVGYACNGEEGLRKVFDLKPDLITLDLSMPRMDGFSFLRIIMQERPTPVIVVSAQSETENVFKAMELGAVEFIAKPTAKISPELFNIRENLVAKVLAIAQTDMNKVLGRSLSRAQSFSSQMAKNFRLKENLFAEDPIFQVVIGASTGGPQALQAIFSAIQNKLPVAFAISQHMPSGFTKAFAERLNRVSALDVSEARSGDKMTAGKVLVAPGGKNLVFRRFGKDVFANIVEPPDEQRYIPGVDALFSSASEVFGSKVLGVVLTGMGNDGARGVVDIKKHGGQVIAESEETSVVFGMPQKAIASGNVDKVVPLPLICTEMLKRCCP